MKILILSAFQDSYSTKRLAEEITAKKEDYEVINPSDLYAVITPTITGHDQLFKRGKVKSERISKKSFDAVIPRIAGTGFDHGVMIVKHLTANMHTFSTGYEPGLKVCSNKFLTSQVLSRANIRNPKQVLAHQPTDYKELINLVGGLPCIGKIQKGSLGQGVFILTDELAASTSLNSFQTLGSDIILQQRIDSGHPAADIRIIVIGPEKKEPDIFAYKRYALDSDFRSNYSISGKGEKVKITDEERQMAIDAANAVKMPVCGVDIIRDSKDDNKAYIIEVNGSPGLKGIESITGENVAGSIVQYVIDNYKKKEKQSDGSSWAMHNETQINAQSNPKDSKIISLQANLIYKYQTIVRKLKGKQVGKLNDPFSSAIQEAKKMQDYLNQ